MVIKKKFPKLRVWLTNKESDKLLFWQDPDTKCASAKKHVYDSANSLVGNTLFIFIKRRLCRLLIPFPDPYVVNITQVEILKRSESGEVKHAICVMELDPKINIFRITLRMKRGVFYKN